MPVDPNLYQAASHRNMIAHLSGPLVSGAFDSPVGLAIGAGGGGGTLNAAVNWVSREAILLVAPSRPLNANGLRLEAVLDPGGTATTLPALEFAPYTEAGTFLPLYVPVVDPATHTSAPFTLRLRLFELKSDNPPQTIPANEATQLVELRLLEGILGRMLYVMGAEQARLRRQARETAAMRFLDYARDIALDRHGDTLGVPRFDETLSFDVPSIQITTQERREPDAEYRTRLKLYSHWVVPSVPHIRNLLNGPGASGDPNNSLLANLGVQARFSITETDNPFAIAIHLVESGGQPRRANFLEYVRRNHLLWPRSTTIANNFHNSRFFPAQTKAKVNELRNRLRQNFNFKPNDALAPMLANALDRLGRMRLALNPGAAPWDVNRVQDSTAGSRYTLGLGADLPPLPAAELDTLATAQADVNRVPSGDEEVEAILRGTQARSAASDPDGAWLFEACGLRTVHRADANTLYVSHFPTFGLMIAGGGAGPAATSVAVNTPLDLEAHYHAPGDPGANAALVSSLAQAAAAWAAAGGTAWTELSDADAITHWDSASDLPANAPALNVFRAAGLPAIQNPAPIVARLKLLPGELHASLLLDAGLAGQVIAGDPGAHAKLKQLADVLQGAGVAAVLPLVTGPAEVLFIASTIGLPEAGLNLSDRRSAGFRWYVVPIDGGDGEIKSTGSRTLFIPHVAGLYAIVAIGYARRGLTDPYEYRVDLPSEATLSLLQYEFLMNALERAFPIGVEINTYNIRRQHVDMDGDGAAEPLLPRISRSYRPFRRR